MNVTANSTPSRTHPSRMLIRHSASAHSLSLSLSLSLARSRRFFAFLLLAAPKMYCTLTLSLSLWVSVLQRSPKGGQFRKLQTAGAQNNDVMRLAFDANWAEGMVC